MNCQSHKLSIQIQLNALLLGALAFPIQIYHYRRFIYKRNWNACILSISIIFRCRECSNCILPLGLDLCKFKVKRKKKLFETKLFRISISTSSHIGSACLVLMVSAFKMTYFFHNVVT